MLQLQPYIPAVLTFSWLGAFCGFVAFQNFIGIGLSKKIYKSYGGGAGLGPVSNPRIAGTGHALNYALQFLVTFLAGGYATGTAEERTGVSINGNLAIMITFATIWIWSKAFSDSPWLSRQFCLMVNWAFGSSRTQ